MPLYNREENRRYNTLSEKEKIRINDSQKMIMNHNNTIEIEETLDIENLWNPTDRKIYGYINCTKNPPFPEARIGQMYVMTTDGTIGGFNVKKNDWIECISNYSIEGYGEQIKNNWIIGSYSENSGGGGSIIVSDKSSIKIQKISISNVGNFEPLTSNAIIRRLLLITKTSYNNASIIIKMNNEEISRLQYFDESVCVEDLTGIFINSSSNISIEVENYTEGTMDAILEYYSDDGLNYIKYIRADISHTNSSDYFIPSSSIITSISFFPKNINEPKKIKFFINSLEYLLIDIDSKHMEFINKYLASDSKVYFECSNILESESISIIIEYITG